MLYVLAVIGGLIVGFLLHAWATKLPVSHDYCESRFERMRRTLCHEIEVRENEIQRLIQGQT